MERTMWPYPSKDSSVANVNGTSNTFRLEGRSGFEKFSGVNSKGVAAAVEKCKCFVHCLRV